MKDKSKYLYYGTIIATFCLMATRTWCRLGNLLIDTFRDNISAIKLAHGAILYKDVYYLFGILPPYLLSLLNMAFGTSLYCSIGLGFVMVLLCSFAMYRTSRFYMNRFFSTLVVVNFIGCFAFSSISNGTLNFIMPYSLASYLATTFTMLSLYYFISYIHTENRSDLALWAVMSYFTFLSRIYIGIPAYVVFLLFGVIFDRKRIFNTLPYLLAPPLIAVITYMAYLIPTGAWQAFKESVLRMFFYEGSGADPFAKFNIGMLAIGPDKIMYNSLAHNIYLMFKMYFSQIITMAMLYCAGILFSVVDERTGGEGKRKVLLYSVFALLSICLTACLRPLDGLPFKDGVLWLTYRSAPLILVSMIAISVYMYFKNGSRRQYYSTMVLCTLALLLLSRIFFKVTTFLNGSYLLLPSTIVIVLFCVAGIPWIFKVSGITGKGEKYYFIGCAIYFVSSILIFMNITFKICDSKRHCEHTPFGTVYSPNSGNTKFFWQAVRYLDNFTPKDATVLVVPEGLGINYFSQRAAPMKYDSYLPLILNTVGEDKIVGEMRSHKIDYVVEMERTTYEHGYKGFGCDYGVKINKWITDNYVLVEQFGYTPFAGTDLPGILILQRKS